MHTFELSCRIFSSTYNYLHQNLPSLSRVSRYVERTNYYSAKGITQIELRTFEYIKFGIPMKAYYLVLRCNPSIIMGDNSVFLLDMEKYTSSEILERLQKRLYEINEFRYVRIDKFSMSLFLTNRADIAQDIAVDEPQILVWLCNMSFPYKYRNMKRKPIQKDTEILYFESCCFCNGSREINIYSKWAAMNNTGKQILPEEEERIKHLVRIEMQIKKRGVYNMKLPTKRSIKPFLEQDFCSERIEKEVRSIFGIQRYVSRSEAVKIIENSRYKPYDKAVMLSIIDMIQQFRGLYELEKAIDNEKIHTPPQYGNLRSFRERWLKKFRCLGIQPVVIPDNFGIAEMPRIYDCLKNKGGFANEQK